MAAKIKVEVEYHPGYELSVDDNFGGLYVTKISGIKSGSERLANDIQANLRFDAKCNIRLNWAELDWPPSIRNRIVIIQVGA